MRDQPHAYGGVSRYLHWGVAWLVLGMYAVSWWMRDLPAHWKSSAYMSHKWLGLIVLALACLRLCHRLHQGFLPLWDKPWIAWGVRTLQCSLYGCLLGLPLTGWCMSTAAGRAPAIGAWVMAMPGVSLDVGLARWANAWHHNFLYALGALLLCHVGGAFYHYRHQDKPIWRRMWHGTA